MASLTDTARTNLLADLVLSSSTESNVDLFRQSSFVAGNKTTGNQYWDYLESLRP